MKKILLIIISITIVLSLLLFISLYDNRTFFKNTYISRNNQEIYVPRYSYFYKECCMTAVTFYSLRSKLELQTEINNYLKDFKKFSDNTTYGYKKGELFIQEYKVEEHILFRKIIIVY